MRPRLSLLALLCALAACTSTHQVALETSPKPAQIVGVRTKGGTFIKFHEPGATIANDSLYGIGPNGQVIIPTDSILTVSVRSGSAGKTILLVLGLIVVTAGVLYAAFALSAPPSASC